MKQKSDNFTQEIRLDEYRQFKDETESQVVERILRNQLMRKR